MRQGKAAKILIKFSSTGKFDDQLDLLFADFHDSEFRKQFVNKQTEVVMLSMKMSKYNKYNWVQERNLVVTQDYIYVFKHKKLNRLVQISSL